MAEVERRSKPRKVEPKDDDETATHGHGLLILAYVVFAVAVIIAMVVVASFLSGGKADNVQLIALAVTAVIGTGLFIWGRMKQRAPQ